MPPRKNRRAQSAPTATLDQPVRRARRTPASPTTEALTAAAQEVARLRAEATGLRPFAGGSTGTHGRKPGEPSGRTLIVLHGAVGGHARDAIIHESDLGDAANVQRLIDLEAVAWHREDEPDDFEEDVETEPAAEEAVAEATPRRTPRSRAKPAETTATSDDASHEIASVESESDDKASEDHQTG